MDDIFDLLEDSLTDRPVNRIYDQEAEEDMEEFVDTVMLAADMAADSRGFFMVTISIEPVKGRLAYVPRLFTAFADEEIADILQCEIVNLADIIDETRTSRLKKLFRRKNQ